MPEPMLSAKQQKRKLSWICALVVEERRVGTVLVEVGEAEEGGAAFMEAEVVGEVVVEGVVFTGGEAGATTATVQIGVHAHNKPLAPVAAAQISLCATSTVVEEARIWMCHFGPSNKEILI